MKIYCSQVNNKFQPDHQDYVWPPRNLEPHWDFGVEQDFLWWLQKQDGLLTDNPAEADFNYIPLFFNRYYINTLDADGHWGGRMDELSEEFERCKIDGLRTFVISEADPKVVMPELNWDDVIIFTSSRRCDDCGIDIPLLSAPHKIPTSLPDKRWLASFVGSLGTDSVRSAMQEELKGRNDCWIEHGNNGVDYFVNLMLTSYVALCPRGAGGQSFRFYEAMQLGTVPLFIGDMDCRPFKDFVDWECCSLYTDTTEYLNDYLEALSEHKDKLLKMGMCARTTYDYLSYGNWGRFVIKELELL